MKYFYETSIGGLIKVYTVKEGGIYKDRQIVADFCDGPAGTLAFACFREGLARNGGTLCDFHGKYLVGNLDQLTGVAQ